MFGILSVKRPYPVARGLASIMAGAMLIASVPATAGIWDEGDIENGQALFNANCASCHKVTNEVLAAPGLAGIADRWGSSEEILVQWIQNPQAAAATGDPYVKSLVDRYVGTYGWMTAQAVSADDVKDIMAYVQNPPDAVATADTGTDCPTIYDAIEEEQGANGTIWFLILLTLFLIIALSALHRRLHPMRTPPISFACRHGLGRTARLSASSVSSWLPTSWSSGIKD